MKIGKTKDFVGLMLTEWNCAKQSKCIKHLSAWLIDR